MRKEDFNVIVFCEESQQITNLLRANGITATSCDLKSCTGGHSEWHIKGDALKEIYDTTRGYTHGIGHPPCTYLTCTANAWLKDQPKRKSGKLVGEQRRSAQQEAVDFFMKCWNSPLENLCLENPVGVISSILPLTQIIQPYFFGDADKKRTCLWLRGKGFPKLIHAEEDDLFTKKTHVEPIPSYIDKSGNGVFFSNAISGTSINAATFRSKTFKGISNAMLQQWFLELCD